MTNRVKNAESEIESLQNELQSKRTEVRAAVDSCNKLRAEKDDLAAKLKAEQIRVASLQDHVKSMNKELAQKASNRVAVKDALKHAPFFVRWWTDKHIAEYLE
ncbi:MAG: hypothetical protein UHX00_10820 [Caryophanon sp.]|nr:hypothetical protein [Caryophanon sp.]